MILNDVIIQNFRSIKDVAVEFDPRCRVLVGINESGKSNILKALFLLSEDRKISRSDDVRENLPDEDPVSSAYVQFNFSLETHEHEDHIDNVHRKMLTSAPAERLLGIWDGKAVNAARLCGEFKRVCYYVDLIKETKGYRSFAFKKKFEADPRWMTPTKDCSDDVHIVVEGENVQLNKFTLIDIVEHSDIAPTYVRPATSDEILSFVRRMLVKVAGESHFDPIFWEYDEKNLLPSEVDISQFSQSPWQIEPLRNMFRLAGIKNIQAEIEHVKTLSRNGKQNFFDKVAKQTTNHFRSVWKEYKNIEFKLTLDGDKIVPGIKEKNSFDFSKRSDGFKRFVTFLLMISASVKTDSLSDTLLLIDEPDAGLHPSGCRYLRDELIKIATKNYVIYSTHSIFMIDADEIARHYLVKKKDETTTIEAASEHNIADEEVLYNALGYSIFEALKAKNIIFEGWRDKQLFKIGLSKRDAATRAKFKDVGICHANGVNLIRTVTPSMELANRRCVILSDADEPAKRAKKAFNQEKGYGTWCVYQDLDATLSAVTGEDFLKNSWFIKRTNEVMTGSGLPSLTDADLPPKAGKLKAFSDWLKKQQLDENGIKQHVGALKEKLFEEVTAKEIDEDEYERLIAGLVKQLDL